MPELAEDCRSRVRRCRLIGLSMRRRRPHVLSPAAPSHGPSAAGAARREAGTCLSGGKIMAETAGPMARLGEVAAPAEAVAVFIEGTLRPLLNEIAVWVKAAYAAAGLSLGQPVDAAAQTLCPS